MLLDFRVRAVCLLIIFGISSLFLINCKRSAEEYDQMVQVKNFGDNPGNLRMLVHFPKNRNSSSKLVVVLHGCTMNAKKTASMTGWNRYADEYGFIVVYPDQKTINNASQCFNWFRSKDIEKGSGEIESVYQMIQHAIQNYNIDPSEIYISGMSAGGALSVAVMAAYPSLINAGAIVAGVPYKMIEGREINGFSSNGSIDKTPEEWAALVRGQNPDFTGDYPRIQIFQGLSDNIVHPDNADELEEQWTSLNEKEIADTVEYSVREAEKHITVKTFKDLNGKELVQSISVEDLGHLYGINPGICRCEGGVSNAFTSSFGFFYTYEALKFFGLAPDHSINYQYINDSVVSKIVFKAQREGNSQFIWSIMPDSISFDSQNGNTAVLLKQNIPVEISLMEIDSKGCIYDYASVVILP